MLLANTDHHRSSAQPVTAVQVVLSAILGNNSRLLLNVSSNTGQHNIKIILAAAATAVAEVITANDSNINRRNSSNHNNNGSFSSSCVNYYTPKEF